MLCPHATRVTISCLEERAQRQNLSSFTLVGRLTARNPFWRTFEDESRLSLRVMAIAPLQRDYWRLAFPHEKEWRVRHRPVRADNLR